LIDRIQQQDISGVSAEAVQLDKVTGTDPARFALLIDGCAAQAPFFRLFLQQAALAGTAVINNPFLPHNQGTYFPGLLAARLGIPVPRTALLPSRELPPGTTPETFRSLAYPLDWEGIFGYVGFPARLKPAGEEAGPVYRVTGPDECFARQGETGSRVMILEEEITAESAFSVWGIGDRLRILRADGVDFSLPDALGNKLEAYARRLNAAVGNEIYRVDFVLREGVAYFTGCGNPFPGATSPALGEAHFSWLVDTLADHAASRALAWTPQTDQLSWGSYLEGAMRKREFARWQ
jgi:hypothetical protein